MHPYSARGPEGPRGAQGKADGKAQDGQAQPSKKRPVQPPRPKLTLEKLQVNDCLSANPCLPLALSAVSCSCESSHSCIKCHATTVKLVCRSYGMQPLQCATNPLHCTNIAIPSSKLTMSKPTAHMPTCPQEEHGFNHVFHKFPEVFRTGFKGKGHEVRESTVARPTVCTWYRRGFQRCLRHFFFSVARVTI